MLKVLKICLRCNIPRFIFKFLYLQPWFYDSHKTYYAEHVNGVLTKSWNVSRKNILKVKRLDLFENMYVFNGIQCRVKSLTITMISIVPVMKSYVMYR